MACIAHEKRDANELNRGSVSIMRVSSGDEEWFGKHSYKRDSGQAVTKTMVATDRITVLSS